jgi:hypothetical protein
MDENINLLEKFTMGDDFDWKRASTDYADGELEKSSMGLGAILL